MKNTKNNIHWKLLLTVFIVAAVVGMFLIYQLNKPKKSTGSKNVTLEVVDDTGNSKTYQENTDAEYLKDFMDELTTKTDFTYNGTSSNYGMFIDTVNNVKTLELQYNWYLLGNLC